MHVRVPHSTHRPVHPHHPLHQGGVPLSVRYSRSLYSIAIISVGDPDPQDLHVLGPPGSVSVTFLHP